MAEIKSFEDAEKAIEAEIQQDKDLEFMFDEGSAGRILLVEHARALKFALEILRELEASVREDILDLFNDKIRWANICPPECRGAEIALIKILLKVSWERANEIAFMVSEEELRRLLEGGK